MADEKKLELIKKLQTLAERGVGGEKETAQKKLTKLMEKYNIEETDLSDDKLELHEFKYHNKFESKLLRQLFFKIVPNYKEHLYVHKYGKGSRSIWAIECVKAQALQIQIEYDFYRTLWEEEVEFFFSAFIQKHWIFPLMSKENRDDNSNILSDEEYMRMQILIDGMQNKSIQPVIGNQEG